MIITNKVKINNNDDDDPGGRSMIFIYLFSPNFKMCYNKLYISFYNIIFLRKKMIKT